MYDYSPAHENTYTEEIPTKELTNLTKLYSNDNNKYGGEIYDILDAKLQIFYNYCNKAGIRQQQRYYAFLIMLKERALTFYYNNI